MAEAPLNPKEALNERVLLGDPEDPVAKFLNEWWRPLVTVACIAAVIFFAKSQFEQSALKAKESGARMLSQVREGLNDLEQNKEKLDTAKKSGKPQEEVASLQKAVEETERQLNAMLVALSDAREPYNALAKMYEGLKKETLDQQAAKSSLPSVDDALGLKAEDPKRLVQEIAALAGIRAELAVLEKSGPEKKEEVKRLLERCAREGRYIHASSAALLAQLASTPEEENAAKVVIDEVLKAHPEQHDVLAQYLKTVS